MSSSETFSCSICKQEISVTGDTKHARLTQFKQHQEACNAVPSPPPRARIRPPSNGRGGFFTRLFHRPPRRSRVLPPVSLQQRAAVLHKLEQWDTEAMAILTPTSEIELPEPEPNLATSAPPPMKAPPEPAGTPLLQRIDPQGFDFKTKTVRQNWANFRELRKYFLQIDHYTALEELYVIFRSSYIDEYGGYGMNNNQKEIFMDMTSGVHDVFTLLKGETRPNKDQANLIRYCELDLFHDLQNAIDMATMETNSQREADKHERLMVLYGTFNPSPEDEKGLKDLLAEDNLVKKEGD